MGLFVLISLGNQTQAQSWRIEHLQFAQMQLRGADLQELIVPPTTSLFLQIHFLLPAPQGIAGNREATAKISLHRALSQAAGSLCGDAILFLLQQMSALLPLPSSSRLWSVCILSFFSRDPSCPRHFLFYIRQNRGSAELELPAIGPTLLCSCTFLPQAP